MSNIRIPLDVGKKINSNSKIKEKWKDITPIARRDWIAWIISAKKDETRKERIDRMGDMLLSGKRRVCCFPGIKWMLKNDNLSDKTRKQLESMI